MLAGGTAGVAMWSVAIPPDVSLASHLKIWRGQGRTSEVVDLARSCFGRQTGTKMLEVGAQRGGSEGERSGTQGMKNQTLIARPSNPDYNPLLKGHTPVSSIVLES